MIGDDVMMGDDVRGWRQQTDDDTNYHEPLKLIYFRKNENGSKNVEGQSGVGIGSKINALGTFERNI
jgi:hypothetical protein